MNAISIWIKALFTAAVGAFAGGALDAISAMMTTGTVDWRAVVNAGLAGAIIAVLAYLKQSPLPSEPTESTSFKQGY